MTPRINQLVRALIQKATASPIGINLHAETLALLQAEFGLAQVDAADFADRHITAVRAALERRIEEDQARGLQVPFEFSDMDPRLLVPSQARRAGAMARRDEVLVLLRRATWSVLEDACVELLRLAGCRKSHAGARRREGGLDFFGVLEIESVAPDARIFYGLRLRVFGQAKRGRVTENMMHSFASQVGEFRRREGRAFRKAPAWFTSEAGPVVPIYAALRGFTRGAKQLAERDHVLTRDGIQLSDFIEYAISHGRTTMDDITSLLKGS